MLRPAVLTGLILSVVACTPQPDAEDKPPTMSDLGRPPRAEIANEPAGAPLRTQIHRIDLPVTSRLDGAWAQLDTTTLPRTIVARWDENGLAAGVLAPEARERFIASLPAHHGWRTQLLIGDGDVAPLSYSARSRVAATVHLPHADGGSLTERFHGGRWRFLVRALHQGTGTAVELTPHHDTTRSPGLGRLLDRMRQKDASGAGQRSTTETDLTGRVLDELTLLAPLPTGHCLVIVAARLPDEPEPTVEADDGGTSLEQDETPPPQVAPRPANPITGDLGRTLLTAMRAGRPIQMILVFERPVRPRPKSERTQPDT